MRPLQTDGIQELLLRLQLRFMKIGGIHAQADISHISWVPFETGEMEPPRAF